MFPVLALLSLIGCNSTKGKDCVLKDDPATTVDVLDDGYSEKTAQECSAIKDHPYAFRSRSGVFCCKSIEVVSDAFENSDHSLGSP